MSNGRGRPIGLDGRLGEERPGVGCVWGRLKGVVGRGEGGDGQDAVVRDERLLHLVGRVKRGGGGRMRF